MSLHPSLLRAEAFRLRREKVILSALPHKLPDEVLRADLEGLIEQLDDDMHPMRRTIILGQIASVRRLLGIVAPPTANQEGNQ